ncbi:hypothetical protein SteCoe_5889 [Stentor coeruleus]|uniref:Cyclin-like domain-containing protein n=1 Tax=Stentor coeruleus TaxID=5963 RepID=A0A1R2CR90_9CILI|nr:hypothetical protein SteCoe_5889 [Stentor coeruleus]
MNKKILTEADLFSDEKLENEQTSSKEIIEFEWKGKLKTYFDNLYDLETIYKPDSNYFSQQSEITQTMRAMLLDWLMEVSTLFRLKRETYYITLSTLDRYLSHTNVRKKELQLIGLTCLYIACKREEVFTPPITDFSKASADSCTNQDIKHMENQILHKLKWQMYPGTFYNWFNALLEEWDEYMKYVFADYIQSKINSLDLQRVLVTFKQKNQFSYERFHECMELLDICTLDYGVYKFYEVRIIAAILYMMVNRWFILSKYEIFACNDEEQNEFECSLVVEKLLHQFFMSTIQIQSMEQLFPAIQFVESFRNFPFHTSLEGFREVGINKSYEEFLAYQTYNQDNLEFIVTLPSFQS